MGGDSRSFCFQREESVLLVHRRGQQSCTHATCRRRMWCCRGSLRMMCTADLASSEELTVSPPQLLRSDVIGLRTTTIRIGNAAAGKVKSTSCFCVYGLSVGGRLSGYCRLLQKPKTAFLFFAWRQRKPSLVSHLWHDSHFHNSCFSVAQSTNPVNTSSLP